MNLFTMLSGRLDPFAHGLGLKAEGGLDCRYRAAVADQGHDTRDGCLIGAAAEERCSGTCAEGLATDATVETRARLTMTANVTLADLPSCRTVHVRAKYVWRMHRLLLVFGHTQDIVDTFAIFSSADGQTTV